MTALVHTGAVAEVYANWSRWVAECGHCQYGAATLQRFATHFRCSFCGGVTEIIWPTPEMVRGVERLLMMRPDPSTRNWTPGETLTQLCWENGEHGIFDGLDPELAPGPVPLSVADNRIQIDLLPKVLPPRRMEIGT